MPFGKSAWERIIELDRRIRIGECPNCSSFAQDREVSRKTVQRDLEFLRDRLGAPLEYDGTRRGYVYAEPGWTLPALPITEGELIQLLLAERMARQYDGTPIAANLEALFRKIQAVLNEPVTVDTALLDTRFSFHGLPARPISRRIWLAVVKALRGRRALRVTYRSADDGEEGARVIEPLHLANVGGEWYLVAHCRQKDALRHFALSRVQKAALTKEVFAPREFDPKQYFSNRFGLFVGKPDHAYRIKVRFSRDAAPWVMERIWHAGQKLERHQDGRVTLSFPAPAIEEVMSWVLRWGSNVEVLAPPSLRKQVKDEVRRLAEMYG